MMKKNGFTIVELLAVITIIMIIMLIVIPSIANMVTTTRVKSYNSNVESIYGAIDVYILDYDITLDSNNKGIITLNDLYDTGLIEDKLVDSRCDKNFSGEDTKIHITKESDGSYTYDLKVVTECGIRAPIINDIEIKPISKSIRINVDATPTDGRITSFYYSYDNGYSYVKSNSSSHVFKDLTPSTTYKVKVKVEDNNGSYEVSGYYEAVTTE